MKGRPGGGRFSGEVCGNVPFALTHSSPKKEKVVHRAFRKKGGEAEGEEKEVSVNNRQQEKRADSIHPYSKTSIE